MPRSRFSFLLSTCLTTGVLCFLYAPLIQLYGAALWEIFTTNPARFLEAFPIAPLPRILFWNTFWLSVLSAFLALIFGGIVASVLARRSHFQIPAIILCALPVAISPTLAATAFLAWTRLPPARAAASLAATNTLSINSIFIAAPVLALCFYPLVAFALAAARRAIPTEIEDAARLFGKPLQANLRVIWPLLLPAALASAGIVATLAMWEMGAPDLLDARTYSVQIYRDFSAEQNILKATLDAIPMIFLGALCFLPAWRALRFYRVFESTKGGHEKSARSSSALILLVILIFLFSPLASIAIFVSQMQPPHILWEVWEVNREEIFNTIFAASAASAVIVGASFLLAALWREYSLCAQRALLTLFILPVFCAPIMLAIALLNFYNRAGFDWFFNSDGGLLWNDWTARYGLLVIGFVCRFLPLGILWMHHAVGRIPQNYEEAGAGLGAPNIKVFAAIMWPLLLPSLLSLFAIVWALCATELSLSVLLNSPGGQTLPVPIFNQMHIGATAQVAALSLTLVALSAAVLALLLLPFLKLRFKLQDA